VLRTGCAEGGEGGWRSDCCAVWAGCLAVSAPLLPLAGRDVGELLSVDEACVAELLPPVSGLLSTTVPVVGRLIGGLLPELAGFNSTLSGSWVTGRAVIAASRVLPVPVDTRAG